VTRASARRRVRAKSAGQVPSPSSLAHVEDFQCQVVATWRACGRSVQETARELGVSSWTVRHYLSRARQVWRGTTSADYAAAAEEEVAVLGRLEMEARERYRYLTAGGGTALERAGADRYLRVQLEAVAQRRELRGLDAPKRVEVEARLFIGDPDSPRQGPPLPLTIEQVNEELAAILRDPLATAKRITAPSEPIVR
jgi:hypothetical protein